MVKPQAEKANANTYVRFPALCEDLPGLVEEQRRLEKKIAAIGKAPEEEKAVRDRIDALLVAAGLQHGEGVTCLGYDVVHRTRAGNSYLSVELLVAAGVTVETITACTDRYKPSMTASVEPMKGTVA